MASEDLLSRLDFVELDERQRAHLAAAQEELAPLLSAALERFYARATRTPETAGFFRDGATRERARAAQEAHWRHLSSGRFDESYHASVRRIGATHARIGLEPRWYVGAYAIVLEELIRGLARPRRRWPWQRRKRLDARLDGITAVVKAALIDLEMSVSMYLERLAVSVGETADAVLTGTREIAQAADDLARRTGSDAASLEQTSAALAQIDERIRASAEAAGTTVARATQANEAVDGGRGMADEAMRSMERVAESARGIDSVIEGLDKIAFQTRVLAMNAAVEAGRAGEAGRGFAVVADLVSALAMRAEEEAKRARGELSLTQGEIAHTVEAVRRVDQAFDTIARDVGDVHRLLGSMASDNRAQALAIGEISAAVRTMDLSTQQNAAMVEQTSAAVRSLNGEVETLTARATQFSGARSAASVRPLPPAAVAALKRPDEAWASF